MLAKNCIFILALSFLIFEKSLSMETVPCPDNCIRCEESDICNVCDFYNGHYNDEGVCAVIGAQNCELAKLNEDGC